jgi:reactive chlorine resistance protein C
LVIVLLLIGALKFTSQEAVGIQPPVGYSPLISWMYAAFTVQGALKVIGTIEIIVAVLIALRSIFPKASTLPGDLDLMLLVPGVSPRC